MVGSLYSKSRADTCIYFLCGFCAIFPLPACYRGNCGQEWRVRYLNFLLLPCHIWTTTLMLTRLLPLCRSPCVALSLFVYLSLPPPSRTYPSCQRTGSAMRHAFRSTTPCSRSLVRQIKRRRDKTAENLECRTVLVSSAELPSVPASLSRAIVHLRATSWVAMPSSAEASVCPIPSEVAEPMYVSIKVIRVDFLCCVCVSTDRARRLTNEIPAGKIRQA